MISRKLKNFIQMLFGDAANIDSFTGGRQESPFKNVEYPTKDAYRKDYLNYERTSGIIYSLHKRITDLENAATLSNTFQSVTEAVVDTFTPKEKKKK